MSPNSPLLNSGPAWQVIRLSRNRYWGQPQLVDLLKDLAIKAKKLGIKNLALVPKNGFEPDAPDFDKIRGAVQTFIAKGKLS